MKVVFLSKTFTGSNEPENYDNVIDTKPILQKLGDDTTGKYLGSFLAGNKTLKIVTRDGAWGGDFYLPKIDWLSPEKHFVLFHRKAGYSSTVHYNSNTVRLTKHVTMGFVNLKGMWCKTGEN